MDYTLGTPTLIYLAQNYHPNLISDISAKENKHEINKWLLTLAISIIYRKYLVHVKQMCVIKPEPPEQNCRVVLPTICIMQF